MAIDLPPSLQNLLKSASKPGPSTPQTANAPGSALTRLLDMHVGETVSAKILQVTQTSEAQRQQLLMQVAQSLGNNPAAISTKTTHTNQLSNELQALLKAPNLQLIAVDVKGKPLITFSDHPLKTGQEVLLKLASPSRLALVDAKGGEPTAAQKTDTSTVKAEQALIRDAMRNALPHQQPVKQLLTALVKLMQLPPTIRQAALPDKVARAVQNLTAQLRTPQQLAHPPALKSAILNSGIALENRLSRLSAQFSEGPPNRPAVGAKANHTPTGINPPPSSTAAQITARAVSDSNAASRQDLKAALLQLLSQTSTGTGAKPRGINSGVDSARHSTDLAQYLAQGKAPANSALQLLQLLQQLQSLPAAELSQKDLRNQLLQLLQQQVLASLAKLQMQQLHSLSHQHPGPDQAQAQATNSWVLELPIKYQNDVHSVEVRIDEEWAEEDRNSEQGQKVRLWEVMLSFELPQMGNFYAHLKILNDTVSANLWAEQDGTLERAKQQLEQLRAQLQNSGVEVKDLQCYKGQPPSKDNQLGYSLVDVVT